MPRKRLPINRGLPAGWRWKNGAIYYQVPKSVREQWEGKQLFRLGRNTVEAYKTWAQRIGTIEHAGTVSKLLDRYALEVVPTKAPKTQGENIRQIAILRRVFGDMSPITIEPKDIYQYVDKHNSKISAKREIAVLSHALTKAAQWGYIKEHPFKGQIRFDGDYAEKPRDRYIEDWEIIEAYKIKPFRKGNDATLLLQSYLTIKLITGMSKGDLLRIKPKEQFKADGIHIQRHKTKKKTGLRTIYEWTDQLREAINIALELRPVDISPFLFCQKTGSGYFDEEKGTCSGFDSMWHRFMDRLLAETELKVRFTEHDIRAKAGSDAESDEQAMKLLSHASVAMTRRVYRRKPVKVTPNGGLYVQG